MRVSRWWREGVLVLRGHVERVMRGEESCSGASWSERGSSWRERERERRWRSVCVPAYVTLWSIQMCGETHPCE